MDAHETPVTERINTYSPGDNGDSPWGTWLISDVGPGFVIRRLRVKPGGKLSLHRHAHRAETWIVVQGRAAVTVDDRVFRHIDAGQSIDTRPGVFHRLENTGTNQLLVIEVQAGLILDENDIERIRDAYGRC